MTEKQIPRLPSRVIIKIGVSLVVISNIACLLWNWFPEGVSMGKFLDGIDRGYTLQWYVKEMTNIVRLGSLCLTAGLFICGMSIRLAMYFWILLCYNVIGLYLFFYNANESKMPNLICACVLLGWSIVAIWPKKWMPLRVIK